MILANCYMFVPSMFFVVLATFCYLSKKPPNSTIGNGIVVAVYSYKWHLNCSCIFNSDHLQNNLKTGDIEKNNDRSGSQNQGRVIGPAFSHDCSYPEDIHHACKI